ncbi:MAG: O-antigen ligase family protein [Bryobacterales bacterium]|nr:O-antigen ligase family protein [Bryobacterales bacterium]
MDSRQGNLDQAAFWCAFSSAAATLVSIAASQILLGAALALLIWKRGPWRFPPILLPLSLFAGLTIVSLLFSDDPRAGLPQVKKFFVYLILLAAASTFRRLREARWLALAWFSLGTLEALRSLWQFASKWMAVGPDFYREYVGQRITGFMSHWMTFSELMMVVFLTAVAFLFWARPRRWERWLAGAAIVLTGLAIVLAYTRGVWIATGIALAWLLWSWNRWSVAALPVALGAVLVINPGDARERALSLVRPHGELDSNQHRIVTWRTGLEMVKAHPWLGVGPERVGAKFSEYVPADIPRPLPEGWYGHLHNNYLQYAAERGIPALLALLWAIGRILRDWIKTPPSWLRNAGLAALGGILISGFSEVNLGDSEVLLLTLALIAVVYCCPAEAQAAG